MPTTRQTQAPLRLIRQAIGDRAAVLAKATRTARTLNNLGGGEIERRLHCLQAQGLLDRIPNRWQLAFGAWDMLRFVIVPAAADYYDHQGIDFRFHQLLRGLDDPLSIADPTGLFADFETISGHVMQVVHLNPIYDLQLMAMWPDGLQRFEDEVAAMVAGTHPRAGTIGAIVEDPTYHPRLLAYVRAFRRDPKNAEPMVRQEQTLRADPHFANAERVFATVPGYIAWCNALPKDWPGLVRHRMRLAAFPLEFQVQ